jgi:beta-galactosidase/beta-glucuronidase
MNLNGLWDYQITDKNEANIPSSHAGKILVPFGIESAMSGVMKPLLPHQRLWYRREVQIPSDWDGQRVLLHFGAVDWEATLYIDGQHVGSHRGGYDAFSFDITRHVKAGGRHQLVVSVWDPTDTWWQPHGKQTLHPGGCSYTATSGIWQTVWLEPVPPSHIERLKMTPDVDRGVLTVEIIGRIDCEPKSVEVVAKADGAIVSRVSGPLGEGMGSPAIQQNLVKFFKARSAWVSTQVELPVPHPRLWSPTDPYLYDLTVYLKDRHGNVIDTVDSYFGMRSLKIGHDSLGNTRAFLNGKPVLMPGSLDQGFWPDGVYTAPTDEALHFDIQTERRLGFNTVRKHVKVEMQRWYYWADKLGLMVFQDMPTGWCGSPWTDRPVSPEAADQWLTEVRNHVEQLYNHPSVICWIQFNEAFGGFDYLRNAQWIKELDPSRFVDESSGFPWHGGGDVRDNHGGVTPKFPHQFGITSEDGGWGLRAVGHTWPHAWTYRSYDAATGKSMDFMAAQNRDKSLLIPPVDDASVAWMTREVAGLFHNFLFNTNQSAQSGDFYCQIVDVETECDGLLSYDRAVWKVHPEEIRAAIERAFRHSQRQCRELTM